MLLEGSHPQLCQSLVHTLLLMGCATLSCKRTHFNARFQQTFKRLLILNYVPLIHHNADIKPLIST